MFISLKIVFSVHLLISQSRNFIEFNLGILFLIMLFLCYNKHSVEIYTTDSNLYSSFKKEHNALSLLILNNFSFLYHFAKLKNN
ncbi:uncharacterized protein T551_03690 [Pneumocystis jirovecii RU7]|uniref:Uncharacterized protein n=1 Tax=Pneumocystis jirovecii (strain RU7) TaxID=1408657 RepID=A0A0W4ZAY4_PNEJ7|nr:uncharacterized protein T551_03690 [Pneumocystis jirovecii RU7]KTW25543.1 hypothetical protein T551_03690 [Pneumocystis jirovecii RU7]